jgi:hypothetical protein
LPEKCRNVATPHAFPMPLHNHYYNDNRNKNLYKILIDISKHKKSILTLQSTNNTTQISISLWQFYFHLKIYFGTSRPYHVFKIHFNLHFKIHFKFQSTTTHHVDAI